MAGTAAVLTSAVEYTTVGFGKVARTTDSPVTVPAAPPSGPVWASDVTPAAERNGYGPVEKDQSNGGIPARDGKPLTINGVNHAKGLGTHASAEIVFYLGGRCSAFTVDVGIDDEKEPATKLGSATFGVYADGIKAAESGLKTWADPATTLKADVSGARYLRLVLTDGGDGVQYDRGDWASPRLTCA
ncbi:NPCBM/NEW2 domain-containing protein [Amycolatopsis sp. NPDC051071]|uniref:NPCBM/NEW2 domain-containing protein n=1 Tax=Amycolatopsis sp. NPDC051071 TaxID=3154637 RepID=UPI00344492A1